MRAAGHDPTHLGRDDETLRRVGTLVELHVEQGVDLVDRGAAVGVAHSIWPHGRWRLDLAGEANHAGTTRLVDRDDPMLRLAAAVLRAREAAAEHGTVATIGRVEVHPNGTNAIPSPGAGLAGRARRRRGRRCEPWSRRSAAAAGTDAVEESWSPEVEFSRRAARPARRAARRRAGAADRGRATTPASSPARASRPRCCSSATRPASATPPPSTPSRDDCRAGVEALATVLADLTGARLVTTYRADLAWLPPGRLARDVTVAVEDGRIAAGHRGPAEQRAPSTCPAWCCRAWPTRTRTRSTARCAAAPSGAPAARARSGPGASRCTPIAGRLDPDSYLDAGPGGVRRDGAGRHHGRRRVPLPAPRARRRPLRRPERDGARAGAGGPRGRAAHHAARHLLPRAAASASRWTACSSGSATATPTAGRRAPKPCATAYDGARRRAWSARRCTRCARCRPTSSAPVAAWAAAPEAPLHVHLSEQRSGERRLPGGVRRDPDPAAARPRRARPAHARAVHATHLTDDDIELLGATGTSVCMCPTTERDLADGVGPAGRVREAGSPVTLGSDSHAVVDLLEEARAVELDERLATQQRGHWSAAALLDAATRAGHASLGRPDAGRDRRRRGRRPRRRPARLGPHRGRRRHRRRSSGSSSPRPPPTSPTSWSRAAGWSPAASTCCSATSAPCSTEPWRRCCDGDSDPRRLPARRHRGRVRASACAPAPTATTPPAATTTPTCSATSGPARTSRSSRSTRWCSRTTTGWRATCWARSTAGPSSSSAPSSGGRRCSGGSRTRWARRRAGRRTSGSRTSCTTRRALPTPVVARYPSHLHIDLLPRAQGQGHGRLLIESLLDLLRAEGSGGVHLGVSPDEHARPGLLPGARVRRAADAARTSCSWAATSRPAPERRRRRSGRRTPDGYDGRTGPALRPAPALRRPPGRRGARRPAPAAGRPASAGRSGSPGRSGSRARAPARAARGSRCPPRRRSMSSACAIVDHRPDQRVGARLDRRGLHELLVDLHDVRVEPAQVAQRRVAGAEVVHRHGDPGRAQGGHGLGDGVDVVDQRLLGHLQASGRCASPRAAEHGRRVSPTSPGSVSCRGETLTPTGIGRAAGRPPSARCRRARCRSRSRPARRRCRPAPRAG